MKGLARDSKKLLNRNPLVCHKCGLSGGTLVKDEETNLYQCKDVGKCAIALFRRR